MKCMYVSVLLVAMESDAVKMMSLSITRETEGGSLSQPPRSGELTQVNSSH